MAIFPGLVGNALTIFVMTRRNMRTSTNAFLSALAVSDSIKLVNDLLYFFVTVFLRTSSQLGNLAYGYLYPYAHFVFTMSVCVSSWLTVSVAVERYILVCHPTKARALCTRKRAVYLCLAIYLVMSCLALPSALRYRTVRCMDNSTNSSRLEVELTEFWQNRLFSAVYGWAQNLLRSIIPLLLLVVLNAFIIAALRRTRANKRKTSRHRVTIMMIVVIVVFLVCITPDAILSTVFGFGYHEADYLEKMIREFTDSLLTINASVNFLIYCAFNQVFRKSFARLCLPMNRKTRWVTELDESMYRRLSEAKSLLSSNNDFSPQQDTPSGVASDNCSNVKWQYTTDKELGSVVSQAPNNADTDNSAIALHHSQFRNSASSLVASAISIGSRHSHPARPRHAHHRRMSSSRLRKSKNSIKSSRGNTITSSRKHITKSSRVHITKSSRGNTITSSRKHITKSSRVHITKSSRINNTCLENVGDRRNARDQNCGDKDTLTSTHSRPRSCLPGNCNTDQYNDLTPVCETVPSTSLYQISSTDSCLPIVAASNYHLHVSSYEKCLLADVNVCNKTPLLTPARHVGILRESDRPCTDYEHCYTEMRLPATISSQSATCRPQLSHNGKTSTACCPRTPHSNKALSAVCCSHSDMTSAERLQQSYMTSSAGCCPHNDMTSAEYLRHNSMPSSALCCPYNDMTSSVIRYPRNANDDLTSNACYDYAALNDKISADKVGLVSKCVHNRHNPRSTPCKWRHDALDEGHDEQLASNIFTLDIKSVDCLVHVQAPEHSRVLQESGLNCFLLTTDL